MTITSLVDSNHQKEQKSPNQEQVNRNRIPNLFVIAESNVFLTKQTSFHCLCDKNKT